jgi:hypothetical protein
MTYQKLSDSFRKSDPTGPQAAKVAKVAKAEGSQGSRAETGVLKFAQLSQPEGPESLCEAPTLATLATLAASGPDPSLFVAAPPSGVEEWRRGVSRLDIDQPPKGVPHSRWQSFVANATRFLAGPFVAPAAALGWTALDLFGADPDRPFARIDRLGLLWLLNGGRLLALTSKTVMIETASGSILTYRRARARDASRPGSFGEE